MVVRRSLPTVAAAAPVAHATHADLFTTCTVLSIRSSAPPDSRTNVAESYLNIILTIYLSYVTLI